MKEYTIQSTVRVYGWEELTEEDRILVEAAKDATNGSYAPYSGFCVGAAARLKNGTIVIGSNQENVAYPSGLCAERTTLFAANAQYPDQPVLSLAIALVALAVRLSQVLNKGMNTPSVFCYTVLTVHTFLIV